MFPDLTRDDVYRLETARLWLRWPRVSDARAIQTLAGEKAVAIMTARIPHPYPADLAETYIFNTREQNTKGTGLGLVVTLKGSGDVIGVTSLEASCDGRAELGYWIGKPFWGKGYATEAAQALIDTAFTWSDMAAIVTNAMLSNAQSRHVLEKCGFQYEGLSLCKAPARGGSVHADNFLLPRRIWASLKGWRAPVVHGLRIDVDVASTQTEQVSA